MVVAAYLGSQCAFAMLQSPLVTPLLIKPLDQPSLLNWTGGGLRDHLENLLFPIKGEGIFSLQA